MSWEHINGVMIDIEGLSKIAGGVIMSIGAVRFNIDTGVIDKEFKVNLKIEDGKKLGLIVEKSTVDWWKTQPPEILKASLIDAKPYEDGLIEFCDYIKTIKPNMIWAWGIHYDISSIIIAIFRTLGEDFDLPWKYHNVSDARTIKNVFLVDNKRTETGLHDALNDARDQAQYLIDFFKDLEHGD